MNLTTGETRVTLGSAEVALLKQAGTLIEDPRRERPRYFDGRFLAARDLIRDQQYILTREADLGQAAGSGVASGLDVERGSVGDRVNVAAGHGVTAAGELVLLSRAIELRLADIPRAEQLSARFGLGRVPQPPLRNRSGLFVLALRPVEYTDNPIGAYPTSITGQRSVEDGDVVEATAIVLVPWQDDGAADALTARRGRAAAAIFAGDGARGLSANVLPLAMLALSNNVVVWVDEAMVRRELGADRADLPGLGYAPRALRLAHLVQHQVHLADLLLASGGRGFAARENFPLLPSAGPVPAGMIDSRDFTQRYFPPEMAVDFSIIPEDELPALVEEALSLPPIDLEAPSATLESTSILLLAPIPRNEWRAVSSRLTTRTRSLRPAAINLVATRKPLEILQQLRIPRLPCRSIAKRSVNCRVGTARGACRSCGSCVGAILPIATIWPGKPSALPVVKRSRRSAAIRRGLPRWVSVSPATVSSSAPRRAPRWKSRACSRARVSPSHRASPRRRSANSAGPKLSIRRPCCAWRRILRRPVSARV
jgi:hypothetical protein